MRDSHTEWAKSDNKYHIAYIWKLIYGTNEPFHREENHGHGEQNFGCQGGGGGSRMDWEFGVNRCKLLPLEWISNVALGTMYSHLWWNMVEDNVRKTMYLCV